MATVLPAGLTVSHYRIVARVGAGGMGEVYKAQDLSLDRPVAIKILPPEVVRNEERVRRFVQEAKAASGLSHPHIITIHEIGEIPLQGSSEGAKTRYIAMEFVNGETLRSHIYDGRTSLRELLDVLAQAADGLAKAHGAGIIHRDLKPDNIMVTRDGYAKVLDFGLAKLTEKTPDRITSGSATALRDQTREGATVGTLGYMSPEQLRGQPVDQRSDIFSFGCILYETVTRQKAFTADSDIDIQHKIMHVDPPSISDINPAAPVELRRMVRRCLAKDPEKRYQSMKDLAIELRDLSQEFDTLQTSSGPSSPSGVLPARQRWAWLAGAIALMAVAAIVAALLVRNRGASEPAAVTQAAFSQVTSQRGVEADPKLSPDGTFIVYSSAASGNADIYFQRLGGVTAINLTGASSSDDTQPAISPDGQLIAFRSERDGGGIFVMGATGESVRRITEGGFQPDWSPDRREIVYTTVSYPEVFSRGSRGELWRVHVESGEKKRVAGTDAVQPSWSPHGHRIAYWGVSGRGGQRDILTISSNGGEPIAVTDDQAVDWSPIWSPDGSTLYFISDRGGTPNLWRVAIDEKTGEKLGPLEPLTTPARHTNSIDISADGSKIVFSALDLRSELERIPLDPQAEKISGTESGVIRGSTRATQCDVSPDGNWIVFRSEGQQEDLYVARSDGSELRKLTDDLHRDRGPKWSRDGQRIAFYSDRSGRYDVWSIRPDGSGLQQITATSGESVWFPVWAPDGRRLSVHNPNGTYLVSLSGSLPTKKIDALPPFEKGKVFRSFQWSSDGKWLAGTITDSNLSISQGVAIYSMERGAYKRLTDRGTAGPFLSDSRRLFVRDGRMLSIVDLQTGRQARVPGLPVSELTINANIALAPDDRLLYYNRLSAEGDVWLMTVK